MPPPIAYKGQYWQTRNNVGTRVRCVGYTAPFPRGQKLATLEPGTYIGPVQDVVYSARFLTVLVNGWWINVYQCEEEVAFAYPVPRTEVAHWHRCGWEDRYDPDSGFFGSPAFSSSNSSRDPDPSESRPPPDVPPPPEAELSDTDATWGSGDSGETPFRRQTDIREISARRAAEEAERDLYWEWHRQVDSEEIRDRRQYLQAVRNRYWEAFLKRW